MLATNRAVGVFNPEVSIMATGASDFQNGCHSLTCPTVPPISKVPTMCDASWSGAFSRNSNSGIATISDLVSAGDHRLLRLTAHTGATASARTSTRFTV
jgi:hypothetical protein